VILAHGRLYEDSTLSALLETLEADCIRTIASQSIAQEQVIAACDTLGKRIAEGKEQTPGTTASLACGVFAPPSGYDRILGQFMADFQISEAHLSAALQLFSRESLQYKCRMELGDTLEPLRHDIRRYRYPLGVLLHIAAGNVDGLPAYSVIEGLLAGNINILKLPSADSGISVLLLSELCKIEPALADFVYVFDVPSTDLDSLSRFAAVADAVVVWGGDEAVSAARSLAPCNTKVISWGHKLSFAYATLDATVQDLTALAHHICETRQLLCSSCQGIYVDTADRTVLEGFGRRFYAILRSVSAAYPPVPRGLRAKATLHLYNEELEQHITGNTVYRGDGVSVLVTEDSTLALSCLFRNCWVKPLPREQIVPTLKGKKGYLQTCGLLCGDHDRLPLSDRLARAGAVRITEAGEMSRTIAGEAHDGDYPLRLYSRIVESG
jgi:hypothetical protein